MIKNQGFLLFPVAHSPFLSRFAKLFKFEVASIVLFLVVRVIRMYGTEHVKSLTLDPPQSKRGREIYLYLSMTKVSSPLLSS